MLAAIILEVMDREEADALKVFEREGFSSVLLSAHECVSHSCSQVMILMVEGVLPECYFTNNLRGLSVDMAVFRDLLKLRLPRLSR